MKVLGLSFGKKNANTQSVAKINENNEFLEKQMERVKKFDKMINA